MKILFLLDWFLYYTVDLANAMAERNEVMVITRNHNFEVSSPEEPVSLDHFLKEAMNVRIGKDTLCYKRRDLRNVTEISRIKKVIAAFDPDVIHIQETVDWRILALAASFKGRKRIVVTVHDVICHPGESRGIQNIFRRMLIKVADVVIVHGRHLQDQMIRTFPDLSRGKKIAVIPHGALSIYRKWDRDGIDEERNSILFFGRITEYKGIEVLIKAQKMVRKEIPDARVILAGRGDDFGRYRGLIGNEEGFEIHNRFIPNAEVPRFFRTSSIVVLPYIEASQSGVAAIAFAFGKPLVVTNVGSIPEVVEHGITGLVVPPNDPAALAIAVVRLLKDDDLRRKMASNSLRKGEEELSWKNVARQTEAMYQPL